MAALGLLLVLVVRESGAEETDSEDNWRSSSRRMKRPNVFRAAAAAVAELLPAGATEALLRYGKVVIDGTSTIAGRFTELCRDLLDALGIKGDELGTDGEGLATALRWALAALVLYLILSAALRLLAALFGQLLWLVKLGLFLLGCTYVLATCEDERRRNALLLGLVALYLLLGRLGLPWLGGGGRERRLEAKVSGLERQEAKVSGLERQVAEMEQRVNHRKLYDYD